MAGFPAPPLAMIDEVQLALMPKIRKATEEAAERDGIDAARAPGDRGRSTGWSTSSAARARRAGAGFYDYPSDGKRSACGRACASTSRRSDAACRFDDLQERYLFSMSLETAAASTRA